MKKIILLSGGAGLGKSSVLNELKNILPEDTYFQFSITREFYKFKGIENELHLTNNKTEQERKQFQIEYLNYYLNYTKQKILDNNCQYCVIDRSAVDLLAYTLYNCPNLTKQEYFELRDKVKQFMIILKLNNCKVFTFMFPLFSFGILPDWLNNESNSSDGFRNDPFSKNFTIDSILNNLHELFKHDYVLQISRLDSVINRAEKIVSFINEY